MNLKIIAAVAAFALANVATRPAFADASDYAFELVRPEIKKGDDVVVAVRLVNKKTGKTVPDAVIIQSRIDMAPDGMAEMTAPISSQPSSEPGVYSFKADLSMAGRWQLSVAAKVQGEPQTVVGKIIVNAVK
jgi:hypothetical protein